MTSVYPSPPPMHHKFLTVQIEDISTPGQKYVVPGFRGKIRKIHSALNGAIGTANALLTAKINNVAVTNGVVTVPFSGSGAGDVASATPSGANTFTQTDAIEIETNGASTNTVAVVITLELEPV
jgi:hypothetical protein